MANGTPVGFARATALVLAACLAPAARADEYRHGSTRVVAVTPQGAVADGGHPSVSQDGRYVAFDSWDPLVPADTDALPDVYRRDMLSGETILVSSTGGLMYTHPSISGDGNRIAFRGGSCFERSVISNEVECSPGLGILYEVTSASRKLLAEAFGVVTIRISRDGRFAAVVDYGAGTGVSVFSFATGDYAFFSRWGTCTECVTGYPSGVAISGTGRYVAFDADEPHVGGDNDGDGTDVYRYDRDADGNGVFDEPGTGKTKMEIVGIGSSGTTFGERPALSDDGTVLAFVALYHNGLVNTGTFAVHVRDLTTNHTEVVSRSTQGLPALRVWFTPSISADGRRIAFVASDPHLADDLNTGMDVFMHDRTTDRTFLVSVLPDGSQGVGDRMEPSVSGDGRFVAFRASLQGNLAPLTTERSLYLRDLAAPCTGAVCVDDLAASDPVSDLTPDAQTVLVDPRASGTTTAPLAAGTTYTLEARGAFNYSLPGADRLADALCVLAPPVWAPGVYPNALLTLEIDGTPGAWVPLAGTEQGLDPRCSQTHAYRTTVTGTGAPLTLSIRDDSRTDDAGAISVTIAPEA